MQEKQHKWTKLDRVRVIASGTLGTISEDSWWSGDRPSYKVKLDNGYEDLFLEERLVLVARTNEPLVTREKPQMFTDEFISEVIQIVAPTKLYVDIYSSSNKDRVRVRFEGQNLDGFFFASDQRGRSIGEALRKVREELRETSGK